ncbi:MAG: hypothetical protein ABI432_02080 [Flavobacteriales bacterium]
MLIWFKWGNPLMGGELSIADLWTMQDGDQVILTNRAADLPPWFHLHGDEVRSPTLSTLEKFLEANEEPAEPMDAPNIWRAFCGDLVAWTGSPRPGAPTDDGVLRIYRFTTECLVLGDPKEMPMFGMMFDEAASQSPVQMERAQRAAYLVRQMGIPNTMAADDEWKLSLRS